MTKHQLVGASWRRIGAGFYAWRGIADSPTVVLIAAQRRLPGSTVFSGRTAGWLHRLDVPPCEPIEVTLPPESRIAHAAGIRVRRAKLRAGEISTRNGLRATSIVRTLADIGRRSLIVEAVAALDAALHQRLLTLDHLKAWLESYGRFPGTACWRRG